MVITKADWFKAQGRVRGWLNGHRIRTLAADYYAPFDLYTWNGTRIEVKFSPLRTVRKRGIDTRQWYFNIHRHGAVNNADVDFYVLVCQSDKTTAAVGMTDAVYLVIPAPIHTACVIVSFRSMLTTWGKYALDVGIIRKFDASRTEAHRERAFEQAFPANQHRVVRLKERAVGKNGKGKQ